MSTMTIRLPDDKRERLKAPAKRALALLDQRERAGRASPQPTTRRAGARVSDNKSRLR